MSENKRKTDRGASAMERGRVLYKDELGKQASRLGELLTEEFAVGWSMEQCKEVYRIAHSIKGSAPVFGYKEAGSVAEKLCDLWEWTQGDESLRRNAEERVKLRERSAEWVDQLSQLSMAYRETAPTMMNYETIEVPRVTRSARLLIIDDDASLRALLSSLLVEFGYEVDTASRVDEAKQLLRQTKYDLITLDLMMEPEPGYVLFDYLKNDPTFKWIPLIVISGTAAVADKVRCFRMGADDFVTKPFDHEELSARIFSLLERTYAFQQLAFHDSLTGVFNRRYFDTQMGQELIRMERYGIPASLAFIDIDRFKGINDEHGHHIGDMVLQGVAHLLQQNIRSSDLLARYGGEEFVIVFTNTEPEQATAILEGMLVLARNQPVAGSEGRDIRITFSAGVAGWEAGQGLSQWTQLADEAMYRAKKDGRNRVVRTDGSRDLIDSSLPHEEILQKRVLVVDDDEILRSILSTKLASETRIVVEAANGEQALELLQQEKFDLCIIDGVMPKLDGFDLLRQMKTLPQLQSQELKTIMLSRRKKEDDVVRGLKLGADDYMAKPFSLVELEIRVGRMLGQRS